MTHLSTGAMSPNPYARADGFVPFVIYAKFNAITGYGKRMEIINEIEKNLNILEGVLVDYEANGNYPSSGDNYDIEFSKPIKYSKQFGDKPVEFTVNGNLKIEPKSNISKKPTDEVYVDSNSIRLGYGGSTNNGNREVDSVVDDQALVLWNAMQALSDIWTITALSYNGIMYGKRHFHRGGRTIN